MATIDLKEEYKEYRRFYNLYFDRFTEIESEMKTLEDKIAEQDAFDLEAEHESKEKSEMLKKHTTLFFKSNTILLDLAKISERVCYINELAIRKGIDLELGEEDKIFLKNLSDKQRSTYVISNSGKIEPRFSDLEQLIEKRASENTAVNQMTLKNIREAKNGRN